MGHSAEQHRFIEGLRRIIFLNGFDINGTIEEAERHFGRKLDPAYVRGAIDRIKRRGNRETVEKAASEMAQYLIEGHEATRMAHYDTLRAIRNKELSLISMCCRMPLKKVEVDGGERHYCLKCNHETPPLEIINETTIAIKLKVLKDISENDKALAQLILDLRDGKTCRGLSDFPPPSPSVNSLPPIDPRRFSKEEMLGFKTMEFMSPQDREKVVKKVEWLLVQHKLKELEDRGILPPEEPKAEKK